MNDFCACMRTPPLHPRIIPKRCLNRETKAATASLAPSHETEQDNRTNESMLDFPNAALPKGPAIRRTLSSTAPVDSRNSSLNNVWHEDYLQNDQTENFFDDIIATPPAATVSERPFSRNIPICEDEEQSLSLHGSPPRSLTTLIPFRRTRTNSASPTRSPVRTNTQNYAEQDMPITGDREVQERRPGGLSSWFTGSSAPLAVGVPVEEFETTTVLRPVSTYTTRTPSPERAKLRKRPTMSSVSPTHSFSTPAFQPEKSASTSRFAFFGAKAPSQKTVSIPAELSDEFLSLNIRDALFPNGTTDMDVFSPSAFKNLLTNAEGILAKLQSAYQIRTLALNDLRSEKEAHNEELEEAETRAQHLKMQLQEMAEHVSDHDNEMAALRSELEREREDRRREKEQQEESIKLIRAHGSSPSEPSEPALRTSEDLGVEQARRLRSRLSETSFSSDIESTSGAESVFSRCMSPTGTYASTGNDGTPEIAQAVFHTVQKIQITSSSPASKNEGRSPAKTNGGMFGKILGNNKVEKQPVDSCRNCCGGDAAVAWDTVGLLKMENKGLKERMGDLESSVEDALDLVRGLTLRS